MNVGIGDTLVVSVLGREVEARIASLRQVHWETMGFNYIMIFSPNNLRAAPHSLAATITMNEASGSDAKMTRAQLSAFPSALIIAVSEGVAQVTVMRGQMETAVGMAGAVGRIGGGGGD